MTSSLTISAIESNTWSTPRMRRQTHYFKTISSFIFQYLQFTYWIFLKQVIREGDPVQRMVFIVRGQLQSRQSLSKGAIATCMLGLGSFLGDELLSWCLRRPFIDRLPASSATFVSTEPTEAFGLDAHDLRFITEHFRFVNYTIIKYIVNPMK